MADRAIRVAALGWPLEEDRVHSIRGLSSPATLLGYDVIIWDIEGAEDSRMDETVIRRRREEIGKHLQAGKPLVVFLASEPIEAATGEELPTALLPFELVQEVGSGRDPEVLDPAIRDLARWVREVSEFQAYLPDPPGTPLLRIRNAEQVVATAVRESPGTVFILPQIDHSVTYSNEQETESAKTDLLDLLLDLTSEFAGPADMPTWSESVLLPGEQKLLDLVAKDETAIERAKDRIVTRTAELAKLRASKELITATGPALENAAAQAFSDLGFDVQRGPAGRVDLILRLGRRTAVVEVKGKSKSASEADALQAAKWVLEYRADHGRKAKGILVVNGWLKRTPVKRSPVFTAQMLKTARQQELCLLTGHQLLELSLHAREAPSQLRSLANSILRTVGKFEPSTPSRLQLEPAGPTLADANE